jgi:hypothetical protein
MNFINVPVISKNGSVLFYRSSIIWNVDLRHSHDKKLHDESNQETISRLREYIKKLEEKKKQLSS